MKRLLALLAIMGCLPLAAQKKGEPGVFDYYLLTLSWSPQFCTTKPSDPQCSGEHRFGFVVHGMWPQYSNGSWPQFCSTAKGLSDPSSMLDIMPSTSLIGHEWQKHGTCSGLDAKGYFGLTRAAYQSIKIPDRFKNPKDYISTTVIELKKAFKSANPKLSDDAFGVSCSGRQLSEIRICLDKSLNPRSCGARDKCKGQVVMPPVR